MVVSADPAVGGRILMSGIPDGKNVWSGSSGEIGGDSHSASGLGVEFSLCSVLATRFGICPVSLECKAKVSVRKGSILPARFVRVGERRIEAGDGDLVSLASV